MILLHPAFTLFPYTTLFRSDLSDELDEAAVDQRFDDRLVVVFVVRVDLGCYLERDPGELGDLDRDVRRSEEHTTEIQSPCNFVCRLLLVIKNKNCKSIIYRY